MRWGLVLGVIAVVAFAGVAAAGTAPYVDAGLDQEVYVGDQVYLDGGGTWDDDGDITSKEWEIETPDGRTIQPDCPTCYFTHFFVNQTGQYDATLTVRDAEGHVNSDTLYVTVQALEADMLPEPPNATAADGGSSGGTSGNAGGDGCFVSHSATGEWGDPDPLVTTICNNHGTFLGYEDANLVGVSEGNYRRFAEFEDEGLIDEYSEYYETDDGTVLVPINVMNEEAKNIEDIVQDNDNPNIGGGNNNNIGGGGGGGGSTGGDNRPTGGNTIGMGPSHGSCNAPCGGYS